MTPQELKRKRKSLGLTQEDLAMEVGKERITINRYENGGVIPKSSQKMLEMYFRLAHTTSHTK